MGTWDVGPFDNDTAADFCDGLDDAAADKREEIIRRALVDSVDTRGELDADYADEAVAAAALIARQCPGGEAYESAYRSREPLPDLRGLRGLAVAALDRVTTEPSELLGLWTDAGGGGPWLAAIDQLRGVLAGAAAGRPPGPA